MAKSPERSDFRDRVRLVFAVSVVLGIGAVLFALPALGMPTLLGGVLAIASSPIVAWLERRGFARGFSVLLVTCVGAAVFAGVVTWGLAVLVKQWDGFSERFPVLFEQAVGRLRASEEVWRSKVAVFQSLHITDALLQAVSGSKAWAASNAARVMGDALVWTLLAPFVAFVLLKDGSLVLRQFYALIPNRYFEETVMVSSKILEALALYVRAKLLEGIVVGVICGVGLAAVGAPYAWVLALIAGVTNTIPYVGPIVGAVPALLIPLFDASQASLLWPILLVFLVANVIDSFLVFPLFVAQVVDLHPLVLIAVVMVGQSAYGVIGMLLSVPLAASAKVVGQELYAALLSRRMRARSN